MKENKWWLLSKSRLKRKEIRGEKLERGMHQRSKEKERYSLRFRVKEIDIN